MKKTKNTNQMAIIDTTPDTSTQTPIEVALKIDENGMTTASNLYSFSELDNKNFSPWCSRNIKNNKFAIVNEDYVVFRSSEENSKGGRPKTDYKITSEFAKKLSMTGNTEKHEQARQYFIACEQGLKIAAQKIQSNDKLQYVFDTLNALSKNIEAIQKDIQELKQAQKNPYLTNKHAPTMWYKRMLPKYRLLMKYFNCTQRELYASIYTELEDTYDVDISQVYEDYCYDNHLTKDECYIMDAIEHTPMLREGLTLLIDSSLVKYGLQTENEISHFKRKTLFDREPKNNDHKMVEEVISDDVNTTQKENKVIEMYP